MTHGTLDPASLECLVYDALDASDNLVLVVEDTGPGAEQLVIVANNEAFCRLSGLTFADLVGRPFLYLAAPEADPATCRGLLQAARAQRSFRSELLCRREAGAPFWLGLHLMPIGHSVPGRSVILGRDITETLRDRQQHQAIQGLLAKVFVSVPAAVAIVDEHGAILMTNPAMDRLLGVPPGSMTGRAALDVVAPDRRAELKRIRDQNFAAGTAFRTKTAVLQADGTRLPVELASTIVERNDLRRFRIITATPLPAA